jgi:hypothetical protein
MKLYRGIDQAEHAVIGLCPRIVVEVTSPVDRFHLEHIATIQEELTNFSDDEFYVQLFRNDRSTKRNLYSVFFKSNIDAMAVAVRLA